MTLGTITLYAEGLREWNGYQYTEWFASWYYPAENKWRVHVYPDGTYYRKAGESCSPPPDYPIDLNNLIFKVYDYSEQVICPSTGYRGSCEWGPFGSFAVEGGEEYTIDIRTGVLTGPTPTRGRILNLLYWYEGMSEWAVLEPTPPTLLVGTVLSLAVSWINNSAAAIVGHVELTVTRPDGIEVTLTAIENQDKEASPQNGWIVAFGGITLSQIGAYKAKAVLTTDSELLDEDILDVAVVLPPGNWVSPTGHVDPEDKWIYENRAYDGNPNSFASTVGYRYSGEPIELTLASAVDCGKVGIIAASYVRPSYRNPNLSVDVYYEGAYHNIWSGVITKQALVEIPIPAGEKSVSKARVKWNEDVPIYLYEFSFWTEVEVSEFSQFAIADYRKVV